MDKAFKGLSGNAVRLYLYMKLWAGGRDEVDFSASLLAGVMTKHTFLKARDELIHAGFIDYPNRHRARDKKETGHYVFSHKWQGNPVSKPKQTRAEREDERTVDFFKRLNEAKTATTDGASTKGA